MKSYRKELWFEASQRRDIIHMLNDAASRGF